MAVAIPSQRGPAPTPSPRLAKGVPAFELLVDVAGRGRKISYSDFATELSLGAPRGLGWLLNPMLAWCRANQLPLLPILVVRKADRLPSGDYDTATIGAETRRVHLFDWSKIVPPAAEDLLPFALPSSRHFGSAA